MFNAFKKDKVKPQHEENLNQKIEEVKQDYKDYPLQGSTINDKTAEELAKIRLEIEKKYGSYRNKKNMDKLKKHAITCSFFDYWTKYPEKIYYDPQLSSTPQECHEADNRIRHIMEGAKCELIKDQKTPIRYSTCQQMFRDLNGLRNNGLSYEEAHRVVNDRFKQGKY